MIHRANRRAVLAVAMIGGTATLPCQSRVALAESRIDSASATRNLRPGDVQYVLFRVENGARQPIGFLTREIRLDTHSIPKTLTVIHRWEMRGVDVDTSVSTFPAFTPLSYRGHQAGWRYDLRFSSDRVTGTRFRSDSGTQTILLALGQPLYNEVIDDLVVRAQKLSASTDFQFRALNPGDAARLLRVRVVGSETLQLADGKTVETWVVNQTGIFDLVVTWWIAKQTGDDLQMRISGPSGDTWRVRLAVAPRSATAK